MQAPEELRGLARDGLQEIAVRGLKSRGLRMDDSLLSAGRHGALPRQVAGGGSGDRLRDRDAGSISGGMSATPMRRMSFGHCPGRFGAGAAVYHVRWF